MTEDNTVEIDVSEDTVVRRKQLLDRVAEMSGTRKQIAKPVIEATLAVIGEALANGEEVNLQPLGNIKIKRATENESANVIHARIRQSKSYDAQGDTTEDEAEA